MDSPSHPIDAVVRRTGLSAHVIRIWEKRYRAVEPARTESNRRLYSEDDIQRLILMRDLVRSGQAAGYVAKLPTEQLRSLAASTLAVARPAARMRTSPPLLSSAELLDEALAAVRALDAAGLEASLKRADVALGTQGMLQRFAAPLAHALGELWREGSITAAHEHFASGVLRTYLAQVAHPFAAAPGEPVLIVATPTGQLHEIGALLAAAAAVNLGWNVTYLGASLPAAEIAGAAKQNQARAVAMSIVYPENDRRLETELTRLRALLPENIAVIVGGRSAAAYHETLERIGAFQVADLASFGSTLDQLRGRASSAVARPRERSRKIK